MPKLNTIHIATINSFVDICKDIVDQALVKEAVAQLEKEDETAYHDIAAWFNEFSEDQDA